MSKAFVDTTILTNILLKTGKSRDEALKALGRYSETLLPVYAIKEFKAGPLKNFVWFHNKLSTRGSYYQALEDLQRMSMTPKRYTTATALEALKEAAKSIGNLTTVDLEKKYGKKAKQKGVEK